MLLICTIILVSIAGGITADMLLAARCIGCIAPSQYRQGADIILSQALHHVQELLDSPCSSLYLCLYIK